MSDTTTTTTIYVIKREYLELDVPRGDLHSRKYTDIFHDEKEAKKYLDGWLFKKIPTKTTAIFIVEKYIVPEKVKCDLVLNITKQYLITDEIEHTLYRTDLPKPHILVEVENIIFYNEENGIIELEPEYSRSASKPEIKDDIQAEVLYVDNLFR